MSNDTTKLSQALNANKLKTTRARLLILSILDSNHKPFSVVELVKILKTKIDQATIYRNLLSLEKASLVRRIDLKDDKAYFEIIDEHDHHHIICNNCGLIEDFYGCNINELTNKALHKSKQFAKVSDHSMELFGICKKCDTKK